MLNERDYALVSLDTPLISNLNMLENIALIKEVHEGLSIKKAETLALEMLEKINLISIAQSRSSQLTQQEIFYVIFIRAMMTKESKIYITTPFSLINNLRDITILINDIMILDSKKEIFILDIIINEIHYKETTCNIIK